MILLNIVFTAVVGMLMIPLVQDLYASLFPAVAEPVVVPEIVMWKLIPLLILNCIFIASIFNLIRLRRKA